MYQPLRVINAVTGAEVYANQPEGLNASEVAWDPIDPDKYYFFSGAALMRRNLAAQTNTRTQTNDLPQAKNQNAIFQILSQ